MSHEVFRYGEGLVGKVAAEKGHERVFRENPDEHDPNFMSSLNVSIEPIPEDLNFVMSKQRKFNHLQSIPGAFSIQRPYLSVQQNQNATKINTHMMMEHTTTCHSVTSNNTRQE